MADPQDTPEIVIAAQRRFDAARAALTAASARPGAISTWPAEAVEELNRLRADELAAALTLQTARTDAGLVTYEQAKQVQNAARETARPPADR